ncbi:hypothetical protein SPHINGO361_120043 [Sphingomonas sp. EC-HK361]|nr:hypothetical protein SPHINGO361_120043 [Sphingomonas sp. EC-HK361]
MLLLMVAAERDDCPGVIPQRRQRRRHRRIDMRAVCPHLVQRRPRDHPAAVAGMAAAFRLVIAVEQKRPAFVMQPVARHRIAQHEGFEEPRRVRQMPFGGRRVGHRLHRRVRIGQGCGERKTQRADGFVTAGKRLVLDGCRGRCAHGSLQIVNTWDYNTREYKGLSTLRWT